MGDSVLDLEALIAGKAVVEGDPAVGKSLCRTRSLEVFVQGGLRLHAGAHPALACPLDRWGVLLIADPAGKINIDQSIQRRSRRGPSTRSRGRTCDRRCAGRGPRPG